MVPVPAPHLSVKPFLINVGSFWFMQRTHILYLIDVLYGFGGAECALLRTARLLPKDRYRCSIGTFRLRASTSLLRDAPCPVIEFPLKRAFGPGAVLSAIKLNEFIRSERVHIVHTFFQSADLWGGLIAKLSGCRILVSSRRDMGILGTAKHRAGYRILNPLFDQVQAVSDSVREHVVKTEKLDPAKVITIPNGVDVEQITAAKQSLELRRLLKIGSEVPLIVTVGNIRHVKGVDVLLRAMPSVIESYPKATLLIIGSVNEPEHCLELKNLIADLNLSSNVKFLGKSDQVFSLLKACDIFCLPSRTEGMSNALLEAMACGLPCVATAVGGTPEVIADGENGYLVTSEDAQGLADRIVCLLRKPHLADALGAAARVTVEKRFSAHRMVEDMMTAYERVLMSRLGDRRPSFEAVRALSDFEPSDSIARPGK